MNEAITLPAHPQLHEDLPIEYDPVQEKLLSTEEVSAIGGQILTASEHANTEDEFAEDDLDSPRYYCVDALKQYIREVKCHELLTPPKQIDLAQKIEVGVLAQAKIEETTDLDLRDQTDLATLAAIGSAAKKQMIESNLRLVLKIALGHQTPKVPLLDLIQEGNAGLMHAIEMFDCQKGIAFSTYATTWIKNYIITYRDVQSLPFPLSQGLYTQRRKVHKYTERYAAKHGTLPSSELIAKETELSVKQVVNAQAINHYRFPSINFRTGDEKDDAELGDLLCDDYDTPVIDLALGPTYGMDKVMEQVFVDDDERQRAAMLILNLGLPFNPVFISPQLAQEHKLEEGKPYALKDIARIFNVSADAARLRRNKALKQMKQPSVVHALLESI